MDALQSARQRQERGEGPALAEGGGGGALVERQEREVKELRRGQQERIEEMVRENEERMSQLLAEHVAAETELVARHAEERRAGQGGRPEAPECPVGRGSKEQTLPNKFNKKSFFQRVSLS